ncbi:sterile alpha motif domain-containing protein 1-like [Marmota monax]|uniref:sterile alpha motif domain-containing protein 1-like n=1 Tax=Marmota monax TaxID=9995 RepID=UPI001EB010C8|nr:sterile alpha motif domain-containing protein 1-like [Marmota monax]
MSPPSASGSRGSSCSRAPAARPPLPCVSAPPSRPGRPPPPPRRSLALSARPCAPALSQSLPRVPCPTSPFPCTPPTSSARPSALRPPASAPPLPAAVPDHPPEPAPGAPTRRRLALVAATSGTCLDRPERRSPPPPLPRPLSLGDRGPSPGPPLDLAVLEDRSPSAGLLLASVYTREQKARAFDTASGNT